MECAGRAKRRRRVGLEFRVYAEFNLRRRLKTELQTIIAMGFILVSILKFYQAVISPLFPPSCRFVPTCSEYAREAIERYGALRGSGMAVWRLLRCQPFCAGGYDPVK